jgi:hypothetical protein
VEISGHFFVLDPGATPSAGSTTAQPAGSTTAQPDNKPAPRKTKAWPSNVRWFRWSADNRMLLLKDGKLEAWDVDGDAPAWSVGGRLEQPIVLSPARNWVIATVDTRYLEVFDTATGETLGRFGGEGQWQHLNVSADGTRLSGVRYADYPRTGGGPGPNPLKHDVHAWDLADGKQVATFSHWSYGPPAWWVGPNHVFHDSKVWDLETRQAIAAVTTRPPIASPDGRMWFANKAGQAFTAQIPLAPKGGMPAFEKAAVKLQVAGPNAARDKQVTEAMTAALTAGGYPVGSSQWTVMLTTKESESGDVVFDKQQTYPVPRVEGTFELIAPDGTAVSSSTYGASFLKDKSGYLVSTKKPNVVEIVYEYDFRGKAPREAILEECWARTLEQLRSMKRLPVVWQVDGKFQPLPVPLALELPPGAKG